MADVTKPGFGWGWLAAVAVLCAAVFAVGHLFSQALGSRAEVRDVGPLSEEARYKIPVSMSQPKRGPDDAVITLVEWCDLHGAPCRAAESTVATLRKQYGTRLRHVFRHYTEERSEDSVRAHEFASIAQEHAGKFWEARALLLTHDEAPSLYDVKQYAERLGMDTAATSTALEEHTFAGGPAADGLFAIRFGVKQVPAFFVNGRRLLGEPTAQRLARLIEIELTHAQKVERQGVAKAQLYDEITKAGLWAIAGSSAPVQAR